MKNTVIAAVRNALVLNERSHRGQSSFLYIVTQRWVDWHLE